MKVTRKKKEENTFGKLEFMLRMYRVIWAESNTCGLPGSVPSSEQAQGSPQLIFEHPQLWRCR